MYLITTRLRHFEPDIAPHWYQHLTDHFFGMAEERFLTHHGIHSGALRTRYLKDLFSQWRGLQLAYDEGIIKGDAVLAAALWRNIWKSKEEKEAMGRLGKDLAVVTGWMRRELQRLEQTPDEDIGMGMWEFDNPAIEEKAVIAESKLMREGVETVAT
jgi:cytochrome b pre-mRNA-processing protein 3